MNRKTYIVGILVAGYLLLNALLAFVFMERHWNQVTRRLTEDLARNMAAIVDLYEASSTEADIARLIRIGLNRFGMSMAVLPAGTLPAPRPGPFFDLLDSALSDEIRAIKRSGSTRSASRGTWRSASSSTRRSCASPLRAGRPMPPTLTSSWSG